MPPSNRPKPPQSDTPPELPEEETDLDAGDSEEEVSLWDDELREWLETENQERRRTTFNLYRLDPAGQERAKFCWKWLDTIPNDHMIGLQAGGGKFRGILTVDKGTKQPRLIKNRVIWIDPLYDDVRAEIKASKAALSPSGASPGLSDTIGQMRELIQAIQPLVNQRPANPFEALPDIQKHLSRFVLDTLRAIPGTAGNPTVHSGPPPGTAAPDDTLTSKDMMELLIKNAVPIIEALGLKDKLAGVFGGKP